MKQVAILILALTIISGILYGCRRTLVITDIFDLKAEDIERIDWIGDEFALMDTGNTKTITAASDIKRIVDIISNSMVISELDDIIYYGGINRQFVFYLTNGRRYSILFVSLKIEGDLHTVHLRNDTLRYQVTTDQIGPLWEELDYPKYWYMDIHPDDAPPLGWDNNEEDGETG